METKIYHDEILGTDCPCDICEELAEVHNIAMEGEEMSYNHEATELELYLRNTWELYQKLAACEANLRKHYRRGNYDPALALKGFGYPVEAAAKSYAAEYADTGTPWYKLFTVETRREVAQNLLDTFDPAEGE